MTRDALEALHELANALESLEIPYAVGGSLASGSWGEPRASHDVDLIAAIDERHVDELVRRLSSRFHVDAGAIREGIRTGRAFNLIDLRRFQKLDVFPARDEPLDLAQLELRRMCELEEGGRPFPITSPEAIVLRKLDWYRRGGETSERQWRDVLSVLRVQGDRLQVAEMTALAVRCGLDQLLDRARNEAS